MIYDLRNPLDKENFKTRCDFLASKGGIVELKEKHPPRTNQQNRYLHVICGYLGAELGEELDYVKQMWYKREANADLFVRVHEDKVLGTKRYILRSSADLDKDEFTLSIDRFRNWAAKNAGVYLPSPDENDKLMIAEQAVERARQYL